MTGSFILVSTNIQNFAEFIVFIAIFVDILKNKFGVID